MAKKHYEVSIKKYLEILKAENIRVKKIILYGSLAAGAGDEDSDIDLAIVSPDLGRDRFKESLMLKKLTRGIDLDISPRPYSVEQYQKARQVRNMGGGHMAEMFLHTHKARQKGCFIFSGIPETGGVIRCADTGEGPASV